MVVTNQRLVKRGSIESIDMSLVCMSRSKPVFADKL